MTSVLYFLHLKTLDIILLIVNISVADDAFYKCNFKIKFYIDSFDSFFFFLLRWLKGGKTKAKNGLTSLCYLLTL